MNHNHSKMSGKCMIKLLKILYRYCCCHYIGRALTYLSLQRENTFNSLSRLGKTSFHHLFETHFLTACVHGSIASIEPSIILNYRNNNDIKIGHSTSGVTVVRWRSAFVSSDRERER